MPDVYQIVNERILAQMEKGEVPWRKPWRTPMPRSLSTKKLYRGINIWLLGFQGYASEFWATFNQVKALGGNVKKGEKSTLAVFWKQTKWNKHNDETGEDEARRGFLLRYYNLFNLDQTEGLDKYKTKREPVPVIETAEAILAGFKNPPTIGPDARACYIPSMDHVGMPARDSFVGPEEFYSTLFHELTHATGHQKRLQRFKPEDSRFFGSETYSKEELIAELGASYLCGAAGIESVTLDNSAAYLQNWIKRLKGDSKLLVQAASAAQKAADHILGKEFKDESDKEAAPAMEESTVSEVGA